MHNLKVGTAVRRRDSPSWEHGVVTKKSEITVVVAWHAKEDHFPPGKAGTSSGTIHESTSTLQIDRPCPHCKDF